MKNFNLAGQPVLVAPVTFSGEDGFEIFAGSNAVKDVWDSLFHNSVPDVCPVAFGALDMLRIEAGLLIFGQDVTGAKTPREVGPDFVVDYTKAEFFGKEGLSLRNRNLKSCLVGFHSN